MYPDKFRESGLRYEIWIFILRNYVIWVNAMFKLGKKPIVLYFAYEWVEASER